MKLHQSGDKIIVTELRPMSEAPRDGVSIFCILNGSAGVLCIPVFSLSSRRVDVFYTPS